MTTMIQPTPDFTATIPTGSLSERAMTVALHLSAWQARRVDRKATSEVITSKQAKSDAGQFEKNLVPPKALEEINKEHAAARARHYAFTLPWGEESVRILASTAFFPYTQAMNMEHRPKCEAAYQRFFDQYEQLRAEAPVRLGKLYNASEFPTLGEVRDKFKFELTIMPVPDKDDFRVQIGDDAATAIRQSIEATVTQRFQAAQEDLWGRIRDTLEHFHSAMADPKQVFRNTTVTKLAELAKLAPSLSLTPDPKLEEICAQVVKLTAGKTPDEFRENELLRREVSKQAKVTLQQLDDALAGAFC